MFRRLRVLEGQGRRGRARGRRGRPGLVERSEHGLHFLRGGSHVCLRDPSRPSMTEPRQRTLAGAVTLEGPGVHSGRAAVLTFRPAQPDTGIRFKRTDLAGRSRNPSYPRARGGGPSWALTSA